MADENLKEATSHTVGKLNSLNLGKGNPLLTLLLLFNTMAIGGIGFFFYQYHQKIISRPGISDIVKAELRERELAASRKEMGMGNQQEGFLFPLEGFTANLAQSDGVRRFVRLNAVLKFSKNSNEEEFKSRKPQMRDAIISILNSKKPEDILKREGKSYLKEEIKASINSFLIEGAVIDVYYVGFQVN